MLVMSNDVKCSELGWPSCGRVVWRMGERGMESFSSLASRLAITSSRPKSAVLSELYGRLNLNLVRANMRAIIALKIISEVLFSFGHVFVCFVCLIIVFMHMYIIQYVVMRKKNNNNNCTQCMSHSKPFHQRDGHHVVVLCSKFYGSLSLYKRCWDEIFCFDP